MCSLSNYQSNTLKVGRSFPDGDDLGPGYIYIWHIKLQIFWNFGVVNFAKLASSDCETCSISSPGGCEPNSLTKSFWRGPWEQPLNLFIFLWLIVIGFRLEDFFLWHRLSLPSACVALSGVRWPLQIIDDNDNIFLYCLALNLALIYNR